jgi:ABC-type branched-subunit amino acid transport system substrate-binding protein
MKSFLKLARHAMAACCFIAVTAVAQTQGVTKDEILIGSVLDLSGPISLIGTPLSQGMKAQVDAINAAGGIHGRKIRLLIEDSSYDPKKAILATQKLTKQDKVFAVVGSLGAAIAKVTQPVATDAGTPFLFPAGPVEEMYLPPKRLVFAYSGDHAISFGAGTRFALKELNRKMLCALYQDDETGEAAMRGMTSALEQARMPLVAKASYKRGATEFSSQIAKLRDAKCDIVMMATAVREAAAAVQEMKKIGWDAPALVGQAAAQTSLPGLAGPAAEGLYAVNAFPPTVELRKLPQAAAVIQQYEKQYNKPFDDLVLSGYQIIALFAEGARRAGSNLTVDSMVAGMEQVRDFDPGFGFLPMSFTPTQRLGSRATLAWRVKNGQWALVQRVD